MKTTLNRTLLISFLLMQLVTGGSIIAQTNGTTGNWDLNGNSGTGASNFIGTTDSKSFRIKTNNQVRFTLSSSGKLGLGNTSPVFRLDVKNGSINTDSVYRINGIQVLSSGSATAIQLGGANSQIGIGTAAPTKNLDVFNTGDAGTILRSATGNAVFTVQRNDSNAVSQVEFRNAAGGLGAQTWKMGIARGENDFTLGASTLSGNAITVFRSNGNVGIGGPPTNSEKLSVNGIVKTSGMEVAGIVNASGINISGATTLAGLLQLNGGLKIPGGVANQVLTSDASGNATWQTPTGSISGTGTANRISFWSGTTSLSSNANLYWDNINSRLGIGTSSPAVAVDINGQIKISGGTPGLGKVLVSDAAGLASWQNISGSGLTGSGVTGRLTYWNSASSISHSSNLYWDNANSRFGVGNSTPAVPLHVSGGTDVSLASGGYLVCGTISGNNVTIDDNEIMARSNSLPSTLTLNNNGGNIVIDGTFTGTLVGIGLSSPAYQLQLSANSAGKPLSSSWAVTSDARLKKDVSDFNDGLSLVQKMHPVWFNYTGEAGMPTNEKGVGTLAQELQKIAPYMVKEWTYTGKEGDKKNYLAVDYGAMDFVLVNAIQEQQKQLEAKNEVIARQQLDLDVLKTKFASMELALSQCCTSYQNSHAGVREGSATPDLARLEQNIPNPFSENTTIRYYLPFSTNSAVLKIYSIDGTEVRSVAITSKGYNEITLAGKTLPAGTYTYMLIADHAVVDSRQMILSK